MPPFPHLGSCLLAPSASLASQSCPIFTQIAPHPLLFSLPAMLTLSPQLFFLNYVASSDLAQLVASSSTSFRSILPFIVASELSFWIPEGGAEDWTCGIDLGLIAEAMASSLSSPPSQVAKVDGSLSSVLLEEPLQVIGFKMERMTREAVEGRFIVSEKSCQPFKVLHGGVSALVAEALASTGALIASGYQRVAGVELNINHLKPAPIGVEVFASAKPVHLGRKVHVWDVTLSSVDSSSEPNSGQKMAGKLIAVSRVTLMVGLSGEATEYVQSLKAYARL